MVARVMSSLPPRGRLEGTVEGRRLAECDAGTADWRRWGPYVSERAWGTVREDYSDGGTAWDYFPHDHARSRAYRWSEDGLAAICDSAQMLCLGLAMWNGRDPIVKERLFGLNSQEGNHGEDAKEYWWHLDSTPTHSWMRWRYVYPQAEFPYAQLVAENRRRGRQDPEYELEDTGVLDAGYWDVVAEYAKATPDDVCILVTVRNAGTEVAMLHLLPTLWFRNTWSWKRGPTKPRMEGVPGRITAVHPVLGTRVLVCSGEAGGAEVLACDNESNARRLWNSDGPRWPKDGINDHLVHGAATVSPDGVGTKVAFHQVLTVAPGESAQVRLRLAEQARPLDAGFDSVMAQRAREADEYWDAMAPAEMSPGERAVMRQAFAGMMWSKQFYHFDVEQWLDGDPGQPPPPASRLDGRNVHWRHLNNREIIAMPDKWEYPWYAAWDLAFHCVVLAHVDPQFAKEQLITLCREWYMHPNGQLPAYEWAFDDVNPPVHAWAALRVFEITGGDDHDFLERIFHKLLLNFTWWVNRKDPSGNNLFEGGFLGLDNIGPFDRSSMVPGESRLDQADGTAWMALYCLGLLEVALEMTRHDLTYEDVATKFFEHFIYIATAMNRRGLWDERDGFYYDVLHRQDGTSMPVCARSIVGLIPMCATTTLGHDTLQRLPGFARRLGWFMRHHPEAADALSLMYEGPRESRLLSIVNPERLRRLLAPMLDEAEFLSPYGLRALSRRHREHPLLLHLGDQDLRLDYEPGESTSGLFGGNSNWRGPVWMPPNYLLIEALRRYHRFLGDGFTVEHPTGSGRMRTLAQVADDLTDRVLSLFFDDADGRRPVFGDSALFQRDPAFHRDSLFHEYFHGDTGKGLGASHQAGWTALVADLLLRRAAARAE